MAKGKKQILIPKKNSSHLEDFFAIAKNFEGFV